VKVRAFGALVLAAIGWGTSTTAIKYSLESWPPLTMLMVQLLAANLVLWLALLIRGYRRPDKPRWVLVAGLLEPGLCYGLFTFGLLHTTAENASLISGLESSIVVLLATLFLKERFGTRSALGLALALAGMVLIEGFRGRAGIHSGDVIVLGAIICAALYVTTARAAHFTSDPLTITAHQFAASLLVVTPIALARWLTHSEHPFQAYSAGSWASTLGVGVLCYAGSFIFYNFAIKHVHAGVASMVLNLVPVFGVVSAAIFLHEGIGIAELFGGLLVVGSIAVFGYDAE
jgi:drug/metabolite transporter (DMT)-like permease